MPLRPVISIFVIAAALVFPALPASAQLLVPVDQGVGDIDPLATSLRRVDVGLGLQGQQAALYQIVPFPGGGTDMAPMYYRIGPGFRATLNRMDYMVRQRDGTLGYDMAPRKDGQFLEIIPPNTVFDLRPFNPYLFQGNTSTLGSPTTQPSAPPNPVHTATIIAPHRIDTNRADNRIEPVKRNALPPQR